MARPNIPFRADYGSGTYRRRIHLRATPGLAYGELQDDFHHFAATLAHDGTRITEVTGEALRVPWTACPGAVAPLERLRGFALSRSLTEAARYTEARAQCTHLFDAAILAMAFAAEMQPEMQRAHAGASDITAERVYDVAVPDRVRGRTRATLARDGTPVLAFDLVHNDIEAPAPYAGRSLARGFTDWAEADLPPLEAEAALVLRRACLISIGRRYDFDAIPRAAIFGREVGGACHTFGPGVVDGALRVVGSGREFGERPEELARTTRGAPPSARTATRMP